MESLEPPRFSVAARTGAGPLALAVIVLAYGLGMGWLSVERHVTLRTNAEDLGFTDQVIWNFLRGQAFRFSLYEQAAWEGDVDIAAVRRPDSLLAFHVEPLLMLFVPLYAAGLGIGTVLWIQALAMGLGAVPAYRFARRRLGSEWSGLAAATTYLLAPMGQWAVMSDFHTVTLAAPLLMLALDALDDGRPHLFLAAGLLATSAKEEIGLVFGGLGLLALFRPRMRVAALVAIAIGVGWSLLCVTLVIPSYSGGSMSPFVARYASLGDTPAAAMWTLVHRPSAYFELLERQVVVDYLLILLLAGGWLAVLAPEFLMPIGVILALNVFSSSPWMAAGRAHYSASVLPFIAAAAIVGAGRASAAIVGAGRASGAPRAGRWLGAYAVPAAMVLGAILAHRNDGFGPFAEGFVLPRHEPRHELARLLAACIPDDAVVSASTGLVPHLSRRPSVYLFPTIRDADYVLIDVVGDAYPTSAGDVHHRIIELLDRDQFGVLAADDGVILLGRKAIGATHVPDRFFNFARVVDRGEDANIPDGGVSPLQDDPTASSRAFLDGALELVSATLVPSGDMGPGGPLGTLETLWVARRTLPNRPRLSFDVYLRNGRLEHRYDVATVWWYPPEQWRQGELVRLDVRGLSLRDVDGWEARVTFEGNTVSSPVQDQSDGTAARDGPPECRHDLVHGIRGCGQATRAPAVARPDRGNCVVHPLQ